MNDDDLDVTTQTLFGNSDDESLPLIQCVCGVKYKRWEMPISIYRDDCDPMPCCGRRLYFQNLTRIIEVNPYGRAVEVVDAAKTG